MANTSFYVHYKLQLFLNIWVNIASNDTEFVFYWKVMRSMAFYYREMV